MHVVRRGPGLVPVIAVALVVGLLSGGLGAVAVNTLVPDQDLPAAGSNDDQGDQGVPVNEVRIDESSAVIDAAEKVSPAVVTIQVLGTGVFGAAGGVGSGLIYDEEGWILTNRHVIEGADRLTVVLADSRTYPGRVYGVDPLTDLAIVKIEASDLPVAPIGASADLRPGQLAIAIGNPLGEHQNSVTTGVISGLGRQIVAGDVTGTDAEQLRNLIQTDAAINQGNSGGPLLNSAGQVIGINTAVSEDAEGIGFAIPIDVAKPIMAQALRGEQLTRPWIGVYYRMVNPALADELGLPVDTGALVGNAAGDAPAIFPDSPAQHAGLQEGDIIVAVDGEPVDEDHDLSTLILPHEPGDTITLRVLRESSTREVRVTLATLPERE
ncbi:MAG TPA: trypsin-like peptidase domain-containing protein [Candidatus Limnocylindria bacterium]|nr:trypsin-like peptidase domain-containing protein [Candidatus Limnocylindria bacterium]